MRALDEYNIKTLGIASIDLMEQASVAVAEEIATIWTVDNKIVVFAGPGNNGGDGLATARLLSNKGYSVEIFLFNTKNRLSEDCAKNKERLQGCKDIILHEITSQFDLPTLNKTDIIVDALFGTGLSRPLEGGYKLLVEFINKSTNRVVSIDMPSGLLDILNTCEKDKTAIVNANYTFTFHCLKPSMLLADNQQYLGITKVLNIGLDDKHIEYDKLRFTTTQTTEAKLMLKPRDVYAHKGTFGHGLLIAGSYGMAGASVLAGKAALRSGMGKLSIHTADGNLQILQTTVPEAIVSIDNNHNNISKTDFDLSPYSAIAIGPGLGQSVETFEVLRSLLAQQPKHLIIDADGLNILASLKNWPSLLPKGTILTPHRKEWERLMGKPCNDATQLRTAMDYSAQYGICIILKGHHTSICTPSGQVCFNTTGNSGMATAGSGDVLTGILLSLLSQDYPIEQACRLAVWLHGKAGDIAATQLTEESIIASDIVNNISHAFKTLYL